MSSSRRSTDLIDLDISNYIKELSDSEKVKFITALLTNSSEVYTQFILKPLQDLDPTVTVDRIKSAITPFENEVVSPLVQCWMEEATIPSSRVSSRSTQSYKSMMLQDVMQNIPESEIDLEKKRKIAATIDMMEIESVSFSYFEPLTSLAANRFKGTVSKDSYKKIVGTPIDVSEFIILTIALIQSTCSQQADCHQNLKKLRSLYANGDYQEGLRQIILISDNYKNVIGPDLVDLLTRQIKELKLNNVDPNKNYTRRFFENRMIQLFNGHANINDVMASVSKITNTEIHTIKEMENAIQKLFYTKNQSIEEKDAVIRAHVNITAQRVGSYSKFEKHSGERVLSNNKGEMVSNQPNFFDELSQYQLENKVVDRRYTTNPSFKTYVAGISGHAIWMVAWLEQYMENNPDAQREENINNYLKAFISFYVNRSYHSISEIVDILRHDKVVDIFKKHGVTLHLDWTEELLEQASKDTQEYTKEICLKKRMHLELQSMQQQKSQKLINSINEGTLSLEGVHSVLGDYQNVFSDEFFHRCDWLKFIDMALTMKTHLNENELDSLHRIFCSGLKEHMQKYDLENGDIKERMVNVLQNGMFSHYSLFETFFDYMIPVPSASFIGILENLQDTHWKKLVDDYLQRENKNSIAEVFLSVVPEQILKALSQDQLDALKHNSSMMSYKLDLLGLLTPPQSEETSTLVSDPQPNAIDIGINRLGSMPQPATITILLGMLAWNQMTDEQFERLMGIIVDADEPGLMTGLIVYLIENHQNLLEHEGYNSEGWCSLLGCALELNSNACHDELILSIKEITYAVINATKFQDGKAEEDTASLKILLAVFQQFVIPDYPSLKNFFTEGCQSITATQLESFVNKLEPSQWIHLMTCYMGRPRKEPANDLFLKLIPNEVLLKLDGEICKELQRGSSMMVERLQTLSAANTNPKQKDAVSSPSQAGMFSMKLGEERTNKINREKEDVVQNTLPPRSLP